MRLVIIMLCLTVLNLQAEDTTFKSGRIALAKKSLDKRLKKAYYAYLKTVLSEYKITENKNDSRESEKLQKEVLKILAKDSDTLIANLAGTKWKWSSSKSHKDSTDWILFNNDGTVRASWRTESYPITFYSAYKMDIAGHVMTLSRDFTTMEGYVINKKTKRYMRIIEGTVKKHPLLKNVRLVYPF